MTRVLVTGTELLGRDESGTLFVSGCVRNPGKFYDRFDAVVLLSAPAPVIPTNSMQAGRLARPSQT